MTPQLKELAAKPDNWSSVPRTTEWEERTNSHELSSDLYTCTCLSPFKKALPNTDARPFPVVRLLSPCKVPG